MVSAQVSGVAKGYIPINEAARRLEVCRPHVRRLIAREGIPTYQDPRDHRRRLVRLSDIAPLMDPRPRRPAEGARATGGNR
jgi:excisionase family DNA binding protein